MPRANAFVYFLDVLTESLCYLPDWLSLRYPWHKKKVNKADPVFTPVRGT